MTETTAAWYAASDASSPAELARIYGDARVGWGHANAGHYARMVTGTSAARFAWATYLENARIRELARGEGR